VNQQIFPRRSKDTKEEGAGVLTEMDEEPAVLETRIVKLKQGIIQELLTGKTRLV